MDIQNGMNRRKLDRVVRQLGGMILDVRRTGEQCYYHSRVGYGPKMKTITRRKDATREAVDWVRNLWDLMNPRDAA